MTSDNVFSDWLTSLESFFDKKNVIFTSREYINSENWWRSWSLFIFLGHSYEDLSVMCNKIHKVRLHFPSYSGSDSGKYILSVLLIDNFVYSNEITY
jgi:hypothetical protein